MGRYPVLGFLPLVLNTFRQKTAFSGSVAVKIHPTGQQLQQTVLVQASNLILLASTHSTSVEQLRSMGLGVAILAPSHSETAGVCMTADAVL